MLTLLVPILLASVLGKPPESGGELFAQHCAACHGEQAYGSQFGPTLHGVGMASVDFYLFSGRMPAAAPWVEIEERGARVAQRLPLDQIRAIEAYLAPIVAGGPPLPLVLNGNAERGRDMYELNCEQCHAVKGVGGSVGGSSWAPALGRASINMVADAIRSGPEEMPRFGPHQLSQRDLDDLAAFVMEQASRQEEAARPPYGSTGPVPEGAISYVAIILLVIFVFVFWRVDTPPRRREEAVRHNEGEQPS